jgi:hypothetical protein
MLSARGRYDVDRYRELQDKLERLVAKLSLPTSKRERVRGVLSYLEQSEVILSGLLPERIKADLAPYEEQCPWGVDLDIAEDYINAYSGLRIAWDMLFYMTNKAEADVAVLELGAEDSAAWDEGIIYHNRPPLGLWKEVLSRAERYPDQEIHVYHYDNHPLTKLPAIRDEDLEYQANRSDLTDRQMRALVWAPWL